MNGTSEIIQILRQVLESEEQSEDLTRPPRDIYQKTAAYVQKLRKSTDMSAGDPSSRLARKELWLIQGMGKQLLDKRLAKAIDMDSTRSLLPEERYIHELRLEFERMRVKFSDAIINGQPSVFAILQKNQMEKMITVGFQRPMGEIVGFDLNRYGPFKVHDVARLPAANAEVLMSNGDARRIYPSGSF